MAIAFPNLSPPGNLDPYILSGRSFAFPVTACLWIEESALDATFSWASQWPGNLKAQKGPISLVLVTSVQSDSAEYAQLLKRLHEISGMLSIPSQLSLHVLHVYSPSGSSSNTYLNIARLLSRTVQVILFPGGPPTFQARDDQRIFLAHLNPKTSSSILNNELQKSHSDKAISPVILARNHPVWCTERYFIFGSRMLDWEECLWQLQLESSGDVSVIESPVEFVASIVNTTSDVSSFAMKYRRRWSSKFRTEACALSSKRSQALDAFNKKVDKKELHWRKKFCRDVRLF
ncbi:hypothetical protein BJ138DRAFT_1001323 [Hygrophoropsis aurantiaca]|uniref:Uncharacterized protein n=1 Tax=Hygrophoropsis aurantiaca TaxID=72124 RepID=A0ACB8ALX8_9AGAM|nr:hypothetical protein BJ138DRAFT_1001323 [Hygrophoropsis aurantiaca]